MVVATEGGMSGKSSHGGSVACVPERRENLAGVETTGPAGGTILALKHESENRAVGHYSCAPSKAQVNKCHGTGGFALLHHRLSSCNLSGRGSIKRLVGWTAAWILFATSLLVISHDAIAEAPKRDLEVLVVVGAGGADEYEGRFHREAEVWNGVCRKAGVVCSVIGAGESKEGETDAAALQGWIKEFIAKKSGALWIVLIGHGSFDGREAKFNLRGPDITAADLASWLKPMTRELAVINTASASGSFIKALAGPGRVIITATKSADEVFATRFGGHFVKAIGGEAEADQDGDGQVSLLEAFLWASQQVTRFYDNEGRLATEHALIEDNGDGIGTRAEAFEGLRLKTKPEKGGTPDGLLARQWVLLLNEEESKLSEVTRRKRDALEREAEAIRAKKGAMGDEEYYLKLERVFLEIAKLYRN
jgi:hypothetical protein